MNRVAVRPAIAAVAAVANGAAHEPLQSPPTGSPNTTEAAAEGSRPRGGARRARRAGRPQEDAAEPPGDGGGDRRLTPADPSTLAPPPLARPSPIVGEWPHPPGGGGLHDGGSIAHPGWMVAAPSPRGPPSPTVATAAAAAAGWASPPVPEAVAAANPPPPPGAEPPRLAPAAAEVGEATEAAAAAATAVTGQLRPLPATIGKGYGRVAGVTGERVLPHGGVGGWWWMVMAPPLRQGRPGEVSQQTRPSRPRTEHLRDRYCGGG